MAGGAIQGSFSTGGRSPLPVDCCVLRVLGLCAWLVSSLALGAEPPSPPPGAAAPAWETLRWFEAVPPGATVVVDNPYGDLYARFGGYEDRVEIQATRQRLESDLAPLEVARVHSDAGLDVRVAPAGAGPEAHLETRDRTDMVVFVPRGIRLDARTVRGTIEAKGLESDLVASSIAGDLRIRDIRGHVQAKTARGAIMAVLASDVTRAAQELTTETGTIEVYLRDDAAFDVRIATSGVIGTDFSIDIAQHRGEEPGKYGSASVGKDGSRLTLWSKRGDVRLLALPGTRTPTEQDGDHP